MMEQNYLYRRLIELLEMIELCMGEETPEYRIIRKRILDIANDIRRTYE